MIRRFADLAAVLPAALLVTPLALLLAVVVLCSLGRPILFRQERSGRNGIPFTLYKFRTMHQPPPGMNLLAGDDVRTPPLGQLLRRTRLDEIPQLLNVVRGDMGVIGPRPLLVETIRAMGNDGHVRGMMRPGLTGWAQAHGGPRLTDRDKLALDCWYVESHNILLDLKILMLTIRVILFGDRINVSAVEDAHARITGRRG